MEQLCNFKIYECPKESVRKQQEVLKERNLKVYDQGRGCYGNMPTIILKGHWLKHFGFNLHDQVIVICNEDVLIIRKVNKG